MLKIAKISKITQFQMPSPPRRFQISTNIYLEVINGGQKGVKGQMADLTETRLWRTAPFYNCGIDVFRFFNIRLGKVTRASPGVRKEWVLIFSCLYFRATLLEILDSMDTASFTIAFKRFQTIRLDFVYLRSDAGSMFIGAKNKKAQEETNTPDNVISEVRSKWKSQGKKWQINPPIASHFG